MFWNHKRKKPAPVFQAPDTAVHLYLGGFYYDEKPIRSSYQMLCMHPQDITGDPTFLAFALRCAKLILADYPFVLESVIGNDYEAGCSPIIIGMYHKNIPVDLILFADPGGEQPRTYACLPI